ncbi:hypothetical protein [Thermococcus sp. 2319x1]|uniref:hypothetical protein n=1 Tax=Thermococcus sp. 2319x1 TaxID=1674923 RepID=UPI0015819DE8|nr:hypothetical protein [Thermococcus sp. 2319x1]
MATEINTLFKIIAVLENSEEFKRVLIKRGGACKRHVDSGYCRCEKKEMCNIALAEGLQEDPALVLRKWRRILFYLEEVGLITTRKEKAPANSPRRYIKLSKDWIAAIEKAIEQEKEKLKEKWEP